jgi:hypothetical protein
MFCPDFCAVVDDGQIEQNETAASKICTMLKNGFYNLASWRQFPPRHRAGNVL